MLCKNVLNFESIPNEINEVPNNTVTTSSSASLNLKFGEQLNDNIEHAVTLNIEKVPNVDAAYDTMKDDVSDFNIEASSDDLTTTAGLEKRRSSRVGFFIKCTMFFLFLDALYYRVTLCLTKLCCNCNLWF